MFESDPGYLRDHLCGPDCLYPVKIFLRDNRRILAEACADAALGAGCGYAIPVKRTTMHSRDVVCALIFFLALLHFEQPIPKSGQIELDSVVERYLHFAHRAR